MGVESRSERPGPGAPQRRLRNYLLDNRFQLKYTGMVVAVTVLVASVLGGFAYRYSKGQTQALQVQMVAMSADLDPATIAAIESDAKAEDTRVLVGIALGISILAICLAITGILVTHKVVGPAYKMRLLFKGVERGHLRVNGSLRKGDELQDVFKAFEAMVSTLRSKQADEIQCLDDAIVAAQQSGVSEENLRVFRELRGRMQAELD